MTVSTQFLSLKTRISTALSRPSVLILVGILIGLTWLRLARLLLLPMFHDEGLHISRAQQVLSERTLMVSTEGGKFLQVWLLALVLPLAGNVLLVGRTLSAAGGVLGGIGCFLLTRQLYQRTEVALASTALYAIGPYLLFFDRMVLADGLLSTLAVWILLLSLVAVRRGRWGHILALGVSLGLATTAKLNGVTFLVFPALAAWLWRGKRPWRALLPGLVVAGLLAVPWLLPPLLDFIPQYKSTIARSWVDSEAAGVPHLTRLGQNSNTIVAVLWTYLTPSFLFLALAEVGRGLRRRDKSSLLLSLAASITLAFFFLTTGVGKFYPRYILPAFPFLLILAARGLVALADWLDTRWLQTRHPLRRGLLVGLVLLASLPAVRFDYLLLTNPARVSWLAVDRWQYVDGWPAGYGMLEATAFLRQQADELGTIIVVKRATSVLRTGAWLHYLSRPNIIFAAINFKHADSQELLQLLQTAPAPVFAVLDRPNDDRYAADFSDGPYAPYSNLVATYTRPSGDSWIEVYRLVPPPQLPP